MSTQGRFRRRIATALHSSASEAAGHVTLNIKGAPPRTAKMMTKLAVKSGYITKRNEQAVWQRRYCTMVPHTLLYYFDAEDSDAPRGIIDLEYYTDVSTDATQTVRLAPGEGISSRTFYLQLDNEAETTEWIAAFNRERYFMVREERDAYMNLQNEFSSEIRLTSEAMNAAAMEKEQLQSNLATERQSSTYLLGQISFKIRALLTKFSVNTSSDASPEALPWALDKLEDLLADREEAYKKAVDRAQVRLQEQINNEAVKTARFEDGMTGLEEQLKSQQQALLAEIERQKALRLQTDQDLASVREQKHLLQAQYAQSQINLKVAANQQKIFENKIADLTAEKKLLIKEFKAARAVLDKSRKVNKRLLHAYESLQRKHDTLTAVVEGVKNGSISTEDVAPLSRSDSVSSELSAMAEDNGHGEESCSSGSDNGSLGPDEGIASSVATTPKRNGESHDDANPNGAQDRLRRSQSTPVRSSPKSGLPSCKSLPGEAGGLPVPPTPGATAMLRGFGSKLRDMLNEVDHIEDLLFTDGPLSRSHASSTSSSSSTPGRTHPATSSPLASPSSSPQPPREPQRCRRCGGTLEGPKLSTCKCVQPLVGDAPAAATSGEGSKLLSGMLSMFSRQDIKSALLNRDTSAKLSSAFATSPLRPKKSVTDVSSPSNRLLHKPSLSLGEGDLIDMSPMTEELAMAAEDPAASSDEPAVQQAQSQNVEAGLPGECQDDVLRHDVKTGLPNEEHCELLCKGPTVCAS